MPANIKLYAFTYDHNTVESENLHNVSVAVGVLGRKKKITGSATGDIAIAYDIGEDGIYASAHVVLNEADKHSYWGEDSDKSFPYQYTTHILAERQLVDYQTKDEIEDNSDALHAIYQQLVKKSLDKR
jgi:hypothetical protein